MSGCVIFPNPRSLPGPEYRQWPAVSVQAHFDARAEIASWPYYAPTPLHSLAALAGESGLAAIHYKDESQRFGVRSFKALGGAYAVLRLIQQHVQRETGATPSSADLRLGAHAAIAAQLTVTTATAGNHGRAVAWGAAEFGCRAVIYVPRTCSPIREHAIASLGADVVRTPSDYDDTVRQCAADAARNGWQVVSDTSWEGYEEIPATIMAGYTVMVFEAAEQLGPPPTHVFVQGGVGGLAAAACAHYWLRCGAARPRFIVVEPEGAACLMSSARAGRPTRPAGEIHTIMACLECGEVSPVAWQVLDKGANFFMTIPDDAAPATMRRLAQSGIIAGESGVAGLAGVLAAVQDPQARTQLQLTNDSRVLVFGTEGATDPLMWRKLVSELAPGPLTAGP